MRHHSLSLHLDEFLHGEYHAKGLGNMRVVHRLHAPLQAERSERVLDAFTAGDSGASEGDAGGRVVEGGAEDEGSDGGGGGGAVVAARKCSTYGCIEGW
jgi:hypothetical protein